MERMLLIVPTLYPFENADQQIVGLGLENIIAVAMPDAVLVAKKDSPRCKSC